MTNAINVLVKSHKSNGSKGSLLDNVRTQINGTTNSWAQQPGPSVCSFLFFFFISLLVGFFVGMFFTENIVYLEIEVANETTHESLRTINTNLYDAQQYTPQQLHLSMGQDSSQIYVTWSTMAPTKSSLVYCRTFDGRSCNQDIVAPGVMEEVVIEESDDKWIQVTGRSKRTLYTYRAKMTDLETSPVSDSLYLYKVMSQPGTKSSKTYYSASYQYIARDLQDPFRELKMALYGDLGLVNGQSISRLIRDVDEDRYDAIIHNGDFAYDLNTHLGQYGDEFMNKIEPIAARVPYQVSVGNHEVAENFTHYDHRFTMINSGGATDVKRNNFYYSFNMGPVHFVSFSTEFYYFLSYSGIAPLYNQYEWLKKDLAHAASPSERAKRPWIVVFGHRPMYCSSRDGDDCSKDSNLLRKGLPFVGSFALEKLFYDFGVDVELYSHEHQYERFLPIYDGKVLNGTDDSEDPYNNPKAPVHLISGSAGCQERLDPFKGTPATGSIKQISDYGYTRLSATRCALRFEQVSDDKSGTVVDEFIITKSRQNFPAISQEKYDCSLVVPFAS